MVIASWQPSNYSRESLNCFAKNARFVSAADARRIAAAGDVALRPCGCDRCQL